MSAPNHTDLLQQLVPIVRAAGERVMAVYATDFDVLSKDDASPVTAADQQAEDLITEALMRLTPGIPVVGEEAVSGGARPTIGERFWLVDPLDGTKEFISRNGEFTVNVALVRDHQPVLGVVAAPALGLTYYAAVGHGAFRVQHGQAPESIHVRPAGDLLVVVGSRSHRGDSLDGLIAKLGAHEMRPMGSALKFCLVAEGSADFYPRLGPTSEWDTAAAQAVLEVAGGAVTTLDGQPLRYNRRDTLLNPFFLAFGDPSRDWAALV